MRNERLPQIYRVKDEFWERLKGLLPVAKGSGRRATRDKECFEGIVFVLRTGCQWSELPREYPPKSTVHDRLQKWVEAEIFEKLWAELLVEYDEKEGLDWEWLSIDTSSVKSPLGGKKNRS